jgi:ATP-dependent Lhr-like helicase
VWDAVQDAPAADAQEACTLRIRALLSRWGVVCRPLLRQENNLGAWPQMLRRLRQMELQGEVLGGYFIEGISGEQFADAKALRLLTRLKDSPQPHALLVTSAADPINLTGMLGDGPKVPRLRKHRLILRDGVPIAYWAHNTLHRLGADRATDGELLTCLANHHTARAQAALPARGRAISPF